MSAVIGTIGWARHTGGRLTFREKLRLMADAVSLQMRVLPQQVRWRLGFAEGSHPAIDVDSIRPPDTRAAKAAEAHCRETSDPYLVNHCLRTYLWGRVLGAQARLSFDEELFYVASLLHDLGLTQSYAERPTGVPCFAVRGASGARQLVQEAGWSAERQEKVAEAITLHVNVSVGLEHGPEAHLLNMSTALDVTGLRYWEIHQATADAIVNRVPRLGMKKEIWKVWKEEADRHPDCRGHFLNRYLQFGRRVQSAPYPD